MWFTVVITVVIFALALLGMAVGVILGERSIKGSCGGLSGMKDSNGKILCDSCDTPTDDCTETFE